MKELEFDQLKFSYEKAGHASSSEPHIPSTSNSGKEILNVGQKIALEHAVKSATYKDFESLNKRGESSIKKTFLELCTNHPCFGKTFLFHSSLKGTRKN